MDVVSVCVPIMKGACIMLYRLVEEHCTVVVSIGIYSQSDTTIVKLNWFMVIYVNDEVFHHDSFLYNGL